MNSTLIGAGASRFLRLPHACPTCNGSVNLETMTCDKCGAKLGRPLVVPPQTRPPSGVQRLNAHRPFTFMNAHERPFVSLANGTNPTRKNQ